LHVGMDERRVEIIVLAVIHSVTIAG